MSSPIRCKSLASTYPIPYFLHGALADPKTLKRVFTLDEEPKMRKARIVGYRRVRKVTNWVLVPDKEQSDTLQEHTTKEKTLASVVDGVVYNASSTDETYRLERHAQAEYGVASYATVPVDIEVLAQGSRRARKILGQTIIYIENPPSLDLDLEAVIPTPADHPTKIHKVKQLARKPVPSKQQSVPIATSLNLPRSPSLNLAFILPRPTSYHGASLDMNSDDILQDLNREIADVYDHWKSETIVGILAKSRSFRRQALSSSMDTRMSSKLIESEPYVRKHDEVISEPKPLFAREKEDNTPEDPRTYNSDKEHSLSEVDLSQCDLNDTMAKSEPSTRRAADCGVKRKLPPLPKHVAFVSEEAARGVDSSAQLLLETSELGPVTSAQGESKGVNRYETYTDN
jgi:hypothetical protein